MRENIKVGLMFLSGAFSCSSLRVNSLWPPAFLFGQWSLYFVEHHCVWL
jgi:hypothetical protein